MKHTIICLLVTICCCFYGMPALSRPGNRIIIKAISEGSEKAAQEAAKTVASLAAHFPVERQAASSISLKKAFNPQPSSSLSTKRLAYEIGTIMSFSLPKKTLNFSFTIEQERRQARGLVAWLQTHQTLNLNAEQEAELIERINKVVVNNSLKNFLFQSLSNKNYNQFLRDLANYYSLSVKFMSSYELRFISNQDVREVFAQTALDYMKMHPHKMNLKLREIMKSPLVDEEIKSSLRSFISQNQLLPQHESRLLTVLREAYKQHSYGLVSFRTQEDIQATIEIYRNTLKELESFIKRYNRSPRWNAPNPERRLYNKLFLMTQYNTANHFKQVNPYIIQIQQLLDQYPSIRLSAKETLDHLNIFIAKYNRLPTNATNTASGQEAG